MKGFTKDHKFIPITNYIKNGIRKSRDQSEKTNGVRLKRNDSSNVISEEDYAKKVEWWRDNASDLYKIYINKFPDSTIASDLRRSGIPRHGHFGEALYEGRYRDAMYRADSENLVKLKELGIEHFLSKEKRHQDDPSDYDEFMSRYNWAKDYVKRPRMKRVIDAEEEALIIKRLKDKNLSTEKVTDEDEFGESVTFLHVTISKEQTLDAINGNRNAEEIVDHVTGMTEDERLRNNITISNGLYKLETEGKIKNKNGKWVKI